LKCHLCCSKVNIFIGSELTDDRENVLKQKLTQERNIKKGQTSDSNVVIVFNLQIISHMKIQQLQQNLEIAQQQEIQYKAQMEVSVERAPNQDFLSCGRKVCLLR
jgi:LPS O-antigen subunit length determinant protein (WzzB/FepE family)